MAEQVTWYDPDGVDFILDVEWDLTGALSPPVTFVEETTPGVDGARVRSAKHLPRNVASLVWVRADDELALRATIRTLMYALDPTRGDGTLRFEGPDATLWDLTCRVAVGLEGIERLGEQSGPEWQRFPLTFRAHAPYYLAAEAEELEFAGEDPAPFLGDPFLPLRISAEDVFGEPFVVNDGDLIAWPVWELHGPGTAISLRNNTTGKVLELSDVLPAGESIHIDTRPEARTVKDGAGANLFTRLSATSALWPLQRGGNALSLSMTGTDADSLIKLTYKRRRLSR